MVRLADTWGDFWNNINHERALAMSRNYFVGCVMSLLVVLASAGIAREKATLRYDDGSQDSKRSMAGGGHAVRFECPDGEKWYLEAIAVYGSRYGTAKAPEEDFQVVVASDDLSQRLEFDKPYKLFRRREPEWVRIQGRSGRGAKFLPYCRIF